MRGRSPVSSRWRAGFRAATFSILATYALIPLASVAAESAVSQTVLEALPAARDTVRVGIAELSVASPGAESRIAATTFPRLLYEALSDIDERDLGDEERSAYVASRLRRAIDDAATRLKNAVAARDQLLFAAASRDAAPQDVRAALARREQAAAVVAEARALYDELRSTDPALVPAEAVRPLVFWDGHEEGRLLARAGDADALAALALEEDLDLVLFGTVEEIEGYLAIDMFVYHRFLESSSPAGGTIARPEEIGLDAPLVADAAAEVLLGRAYATLEVVTGDPDAAVAVDGVLRGFGSVRAPYLRAGTHRILVGASGRPSVAREVDLAAGDVRVERIELPAATARTVRIQSSPAGANVYVDSVWIGTTPIEHDFRATSAIVRLRRDDYLESRFVIDASSPAVVNRALLPASIDWSEEIRDRRDGFYSALTWFVVSVPITLLLNGGFESVRGAFPPPGSDTLPADELERLARLGNIFYWSSIGGVLVNAGLFANLLISIFDYIEVGEGAHNQ